MFDAQPEAFGSYRVLEEIGAGRFGPIYRAQAVTDGADAVGSVESFVAVKVFDQGLTLDQASALASALQRLCQAPLDYASIVPALAAGVAGDRAWVAEPWLDAAPLGYEMLRIGPQPLGDVILRVTQIAGALDFAAAVGIHHGALHPRDILVADDRTVLTGLGVLQAASEAGLEVPMEGAYVSPQRAHGLPPSNTDDVFSLAAITFELVYGAPRPERGDVRAHVTPLTGVDHMRLADVLDRALSPEPAKRPATALEFAAALQQVLAEHVAVPIPIRQSERRIPASDSESGMAEPTRIPHAPALPGVDEFPLGVGEFEPESSSRRILTLEPEVPIASPEPAPAHGHWFPVAAALAIGILAGFAGGFVVGQRDLTPTPRSAERAVPRAERSEFSQERPEPTAGRDFTESDVSAQPNTRPPAVALPRSPAPWTEPAQPALPVPPSPSQRPENGALQVDSRPRGAQVFVNGRLVGTTPLLISDVRPGLHSVRINLSGHRQWVTSVEVAPGARQRVAASLER